MKVYYGEDKSKIMLVSPDETEIIFVDSKTDEEVRMSKKDYDLINQSFRIDSFSGFKIDLSKIYSLDTSSVSWASVPSSYTITTDVSMSEPLFSNISELN